MEAVSRSSPIRDSRFHWKSSLREKQHQLILVFDLLFEVKQNSFILIDEPELSLHVAWQKTFIESLSRIIELNAFDVLLATHSPALVARHFGLTVGLGAVDE